MTMSNGYGNWWPGANEFLVKHRGKIGQVRMLTRRWEGGIEYEVRVDDPDAGAVFEEGEGERCLWACSIEFARRDDNYGRFVEAAREQERIADEIVERFSRFGREARP